MATTLQRAFVKRTLLSCIGYDPVFIDKKTPVGFEKILPAAAKKYLPKVEGNNQGILHYTNLSVLYNRVRRLPFLSAYNIDGSTKKTVKRTGFKADPRIEKNIQLSQSAFYDLRKGFTEFEIGHMAANNEMAWGRQAQLQAYQTFHFPNSVPQAENLNTGIWKSLETYIIDETASIKKNSRICVFTGPLLRNNDPVYIKDPTFKIPLLFYKVIVFPAQTGLYATAFIMSHEQKMIAQKMFVPAIKPGMREAGPLKPAFADFPYKKVFQVNIEFLEAQTGLSFKWKGVKRIKVPNVKNQLQKIVKIKDTKDAKKAAGPVTRGITTAPIPSDADLTEKEIQNKNFRLNMILP